MAATSSLSTAPPLPLRSGTLRYLPSPPTRLRAAASPIAARGVSVAVDPPRLPAEPVFPEILDQRRSTTPDRPCLPAAPVSAEKLDVWMRESVSEIVRGIGEAPFLAYVFDGETVRLEREATGGGGDWAAIRRERGQGAVPDGVIIVEELEDEGEAGTGAPRPAERAQRRWGVVVQGRGRGSAECSACYILDTCRVLSSFGACTHFCLVRAKCFGESVDAQVRKAWLLPARGRISA